MPRKSTLFRTAGHGFKMPQFPGRVNLRMAGQYLLDQRAAGTRHANDENRRRRRIPFTSKTVEHTGSPLEMPGHSSLIVIDLTAFRSVSSAQLLEGPCVISGVVEGLCQCEVDERGFARRANRRAGASASSAFQIRVALLKGLDMPAMKMGFQYGRAGSR